MDTSETKARAVPPVCMRCTLTTALPGVTIDASGVCSVCREYENNKTVYDGYFRDIDALQTVIEETQRTATSDYDCLLLYSGGKDSTYVLIRLIDMGCRVLTMTFDNGYISEQCFRNIKRICDSFGVVNEIVRLEKETMDAVFVESLLTESSVCLGCWRALNARSMDIAISRSIPMVVTGLSRGQIFDLWIHRLLRQGLRDEAEIDFYMLRLRSYYHYADTPLARMVEDTSMSDEEAFSRIRFINFFRYCDATEQEVLRFLEQRVPFWKHPNDVGSCSSNCIINDAGIWVHTHERGYHNYAVPVSWDVRFGHITLPDAREKMRVDSIDEDMVLDILDRIGYLSPFSEDEA